MFSFTAILPTVYVYFDMKYEHCMMISDKIVFNSEFVYAW